MNEDFSCNLCRGDHSRLLFGTRDRRHKLPGTFAIHECSACGLVMVHPRPDPDTLALHYPGEYYTHHAPRLTLKDRLRVVRNSLLYRAWAGSGVGGERDFIASLLLALFRGLPAWREEAERHAYDYLDATGSGEFLEIGFGQGLMLDFLHRRGHRTSGVDLDPVTVANARTRGHQVFEGHLEDAGFDADRFDFIRMRHALEHVPDPRRTLSEIHRVQRPGGYFHVEVPNIDSAYARAFGERWAQLEAPRHLFHFSPTTLHRYLAETGYTIVRTKFDTQPWHLLESLRLSAQDDSNPERERTLGERTRRTSSSLYRLSHAITATAHGDNIIVLARKPQ